MPSWWKQDKPPSNTFNARSEEAAGKPMWRHPWRQSRCIVSVQGRYEWKESERIGPRTGKGKKYRQPYFIQRANGCPIGLAGLYSLPPAGAPEMLSCAIVTAPALDPLTRVHERMPIVLPGRLQAVA